METSKLDDGVQIGSGTQSDVKCHNINGQKFAVKYFNENNNLNSLTNEFKILEMLTKLDSPHALKIHSINTTDQFCLMEQCPNGDVLSLMDDAGKPLSEMTTRMILSGIVKSYHSLFSNGFSHNDIKLENIVFDSEYNAKLIDFGFGTEKTKTSFDQLKGTLDQNAPEVERKIKHDTHKADMYSIGIVMFVMLFQDFLYEGNEREILIKKGVNLNNNIKMKLMRLDMTKKNKLSSSCLKLLLALLHEDPKERIGMEELFHIGNQDENMQEMRDQLFLNKEPTKEDVRNQKRDMVMLKIG